MYRGFKSSCAYARKDKCLGNKKWRTSFDICLGVARMSVSGYRGSTVRTPAALVYCVFVQDTLSVLHQSTQL